MSFAWGPGGRLASQGGFLECDGARNEVDGSGRQSLLTVLKHHHHPGVRRVWQNPHHLKQRANSRLDLTNNLVVQQERKYRWLLSSQRA